MRELFAQAEEAQAPTVTVQPGGLQAYQGSYRGLVMGHDTEYHVEGAIEGILEAVMRSGDRVVPRGHGYIQGPDYAEARRIILPLTITGVPHSDELRQLIVAARTALLPTPSEEHALCWNFMGVPYIMFGRVVRQRIEYGPQATREGRFHMVVEWRAADPFLYSDEERSEIVPIFSVEDGGGFDLAVEDLPINMAEAILTRKNLRNDGTFTTYPLMRFQNNGTEASFVQVHNLSTGEIFRVETPLPTGDTLVADMHGYVRSLPGPHIHIDGASRFGAWQHPRIPLQLQAGDNLIEFTTDGTDVVCRFTWRDTWL